MNGVRGLPGAVGLPGVERTGYTNFEKGWNKACSDSLHSHISNIPLENLESFGFVEGYLAYVRAILETRTLDLRDELNRRNEREWTQKKS